jgi:hypothetical protein
MLGINLNPPTLTAIVSNEFPFNEGPAPGFIDAHFVMQFTFSFLGNPNVLASTGNPHWTAHAIWTSPTAAGFVVNQKTPSPGGRTFNVYALAMGILRAGRQGEVGEVKAEILEVTKEESQRLSQMHGAV